MHKSVGFAMCSFGGNHRITVLFGQVKRKEKKKKKTKENRKQNKKVEPIYIITLWIGKIGNHRFFSGNFKNIGNQEV